MSQSTTLSNPVQPIASDVYSRLRKLAQSIISKERQCTLTATGLVHELYLLLGQKATKDAKAFEGLPPYAARMMKQLLIDRARRRLARQNSESNACSTTENQEMQARHESRVRMVELDDAISVLASFLPDNAELVRLHLYGELSIEDAGQELGMSRATSYRKWTFSKAWLSSKLDS
jgi:RNA polymerase sigma factor (TIGR02999 family)